MTPHSTRASVIVPATSANLGCAFDCAGLAVNLYLRAQATASPATENAVSYEGVEGSAVSLGADNLIMRAMASAAAELGKKLPGIKLEIQNEIPLGVGLGSSAAAIVAGTVLGAELCDVQLSAENLLRLALKLESHPDNLAAAIHGGLVLAAPVESGPAILARTPVATELDLVVVIPNVPLSTEKARAALPASYSRADVVANLQRASVLAARFFTGQQLVPDLFQDRLHQPYRSALVPGIAECLAFRHPALVGIFLSGAGSAVMAMVKRQGASSGPAKEVGEALVEAFFRKGTAARFLQLQADNRGTVVTGPSGTRDFPLPGWKVPVASA